jgi:Flp pilus assembly protein TadG
MRRKSERGQALIEFAFMLPIFIALVLAGSDLLMAISAKQNTTYLAQETAECMATNSNSLCQFGGGSYDPGAYARNLAQGMQMLNWGTVTLGPSGASCNATSCQAQVSYLNSPIFPYGNLFQITFTPTATASKP